jgi:hypothetical protein
MHTKILTVSEAKKHGTLTFLSLPPSTSGTVVLVIPSATGGVGRSATKDGSKQDDNEVDLPVGTLEKMKDLMISVEKAAAMLETGLKDDDIYSTNAEDYLDVDLKTLSNKEEGYLEDDNRFRE